MTADRLTGDCEIDRSEPDGARPDEPGDSTMIVAPVRIEVVRWRCPHCRRSWAAKASARRHMTRCHRDPARRACSTCRHFTPTPCCDTPSDECGCNGLNACAVGAFETWRFNDHDTHAPDPDGWWLHVVDWRTDCPSWEAAPKIRFRHLHNPERVS